MKLYFLVEYNKESTINIVKMELIFLLSTIKKI